LTKVIQTATIKQLVVTGIPNRQDHYGFTEEVLSGVAERTRVV